MTLEETLKALVLPILDENGFQLVRLKFMSSARTLQIMIENGKGEGPTVDECRKISREVATLLDVEDVISGAYHLEVSSPGIDRPLVKLSDFVKYVGFEIKVELLDPIDGQKKFKGMLEKIDEDVLFIEDSGKKVSFSFSDIYEAKLVMNDHLLKFFKDKRKAEQELKAQDDHLDTTH